MKPSALTIVIPGEVVCLPDLTIAERITLAHINEFPGCSNFRLAKLLGISVRGVEEMLRRLRERGLIEQVGSGRARTLRLVFPVEHHTKCEENEDAESHIKRGGNEIVESHTPWGEQKAPSNPDQSEPTPTPAVSSEKLQAKSVDDEIERAGDCIGCADVEGALRHCGLAKERVEAFPETMRE